MLPSASPLPGRCPAIIALALTLSLAATARPASLEKALVLAGMEGRALERARTLAAALLEGEECRKVFADFTDAEGRTLQEKLDALGQTPAQYLGTVHFLNGEMQPLCRRSTVTMTTSGKSRYVFMYIVTASGLRPIRPTTDIINLDGEVIRTVFDSPLLGCSTHAIASRRYLDVLHCFLRSPESRFLHRGWQDAKSTASRGMVGS